MEKIIFNLFAILCSIISSIAAYEIMLHDPGAIPMGEISEIKCKLIINSTEKEKWKRNQRIVLYFNLTDESSWAINLMNDSLEFTLDDAKTEKSIFIEGKIIGTNVLNATSKNFVEDFEVFVNKSATTSIALSVVLSDHTMNTLFTVIMMAMVIFNTFNMGGQLELQIIKDVFRKPIGPMVGLISQFIFMPLVNSILKNQLPIY